MPLWKASYRLSLPPDPLAQTARLQGWAVLGELQRPGLAGCRTDAALGQSGDVSPGALRELLRGAPEGAGRSRAGASCRRRTPAPSAPSSPRPPPRQVRPGSTGIPEAGAAAGPPNDGRRPRRPRRRPPPAQIDAAAASEEATQIAFTAPYKVSVAAGQSLVLPLLDRELPARRIDLYQLSVDRQHPLAAIELTNKSETGLPPGVLTLYQHNPRQRCALPRRRPARRVAGRRQAPLKLCRRRQGDDRPNHHRAPPGRQGDGRRRGDAGNAG